MAAAEKPDVPVPTGESPSYQLELEDIEAGEGEEAVAGAVVEVHYVGVSWSTGRSSTPPGTATRRSSSRWARDR